MSNAILILGESGTGKSSSIRGLNPDETFIVGVLNKPLPFKGYKAKYSAKDSEEKRMNYYSTDSAPTMLTLLKRINENRTDIKNIVIDDFQYLMSNEYMRRAKERGFDKFTEIGLNAWSVLESLLGYRDDLNIFVLSHTENNSDGVSKIKTIGKMLDEKITIEGLFTVVLHTVVQDGRYSFLTNFDGRHVAKSPMDMFEEPYIDNDLSYVIEKIKEYEE